MTECKNCGHELSDKHKALRFAHISMSVISKQKVIQRECFCGCTNPEPKEVKKK